MRNIKTTRDQLAVISGLDKVDNLEAEFLDLVRSWTEIIDPITRHPMVTVGKRTEPPWSLLIKLFSGHFIEFFVTFEAKLKVRSTVPLDGEQHHELIYNSIGLDLLNTETKAVTLVTDNAPDDPTRVDQTSIFARNLLEVFFKQVQELPKYRDPEECILCSHNDHVGGGVD